MNDALIVRGSHGQVVSGVPWLFKAIGSQTDGHFDFMVGEVEYLSGPPLHVHSAQDDSFYVLDGLLTVQAGDNVFDLEPGDFVSVPPGVKHTFDNVHQDQGAVRTVNFMTPGGMHDYFAARSKMGPETNRVVLEALAAEYGIKVAGPTLGEKLGLI